MGLCLNKSHYEYLVTKQVQTLCYQDSRINTQYSRIKNQDSRIKNQESRIHSAQAGKPGLAQQPGQQATNQRWPIKQNTNGKWPKKQAYKSKLS